MLRLSGLDSDGMADDTRDAFVNMAENLGIDAADAEELVDIYLEEADKMSDEAVVPPPRVTVVREAARPAQSHAIPAAGPATPSSS